MNQLKVCPSCQQANLPYAVKCIKCGEKLETTDFNPTTVDIQGTTAFSGPLRQRSLTQLYGEGISLFVENYEKPIHLKSWGKIILGRYVPDMAPPSIDLSEYDAKSLGVSRHHARIDTIDGEYTIEDLESRNGTWLNDSRLQPYRPYSLRSGDRIHLGKMSLTVYFGIVRLKEETLKLAEKLQTGSLEASKNLTPSYLSTVVSPYLDTFQVIEDILSEAAQESASEIVINSIGKGKEHNHIVVRVSGASRVIRLIRDHIMSWRKENEPNLSYILVSKLPEIQQHLRATDDNDEKVKLEYFRDVITSQQIYQEQIQLTRNIIDDVTQELSDDKYKELAKKLLPLVAFLSFHIIEISTEAKASSG